MNGPLHLRLASAGLFADVDPALLEALEPDLELVRLEPGEVLVRQGEMGHVMYVLTSGELEVHVAGSDGRALHLDRLVAGASVGEMALVAGQVRSATVVAARPCELVMLSRTAFDRLAQEAPELRDVVLRQMAPRLQRIQLSAVLDAWFGSDGHDAVHELQEAVGWVQLAAGDVLFEEGEKPDGMYLLVSGRLRVSRRRPDGDELVAEVARGESIGEYAVLADAPRQETVTALRDSHAVRLDPELARGHPQVVARIARIALDRLHLGVRERPGGGNGVRTVAVVPAHPGDPAAAVARRLVDQMAAVGTSRRVDSAAVDAAFGRDGASQVTRGAPGEAALAHWLNEREAEHDHVVFQGDANASAWTGRCLRQADVVLVVAAATGHPEPAEIERQAAALSRNVQLVLVHGDDTPRPSGTARWLAFRPDLPFHHLRLGDDGDAGRLARRITGRALGLVFSGGGARGYAHLGLIRALEERGLPVDVVGGSSMGALVGAAYALQREYAFCYGTAAAFGDKRMLVDRTLPIVALTESRNVTRMLQHIFGEIRTEDLWVPFFCVSANLTRSEPMVHRSGPVWRAVRASTAIPGVFTPLVHEGDVLVDGAVMNAFPVDLMRARPDVGVVIGSNASSHGTRGQDQVGYDFGPSVSGWRALLQRLLPPERRTHYPSLLGTLMRATSSSSKHLSEAARSLADLVIEYPTDGYGSLDFDHYDALAAIGHAEAAAALDRWLVSTERG